MSEKVSLLVGGKTHQEWQQYRIDSDLLAPADDWQMIAAHTSDGTSSPTLPDFVYEGAPVKVMLGDDVILDGLVEQIDDETAKRHRYIEMYGRDRASLLLDCSTPLFSMQKASLDEIIAKAVRPLGIKNIEFRAKLTAKRKKVHTEPGQSVWDWLQAACEANQVWPWFAPDGTLVIGEPDYKTPPVGNLIMRFNGEGNNVLAMRRNRSLHNSFSEITVLGQSSGYDGEVGQNNIKGVAKDETMPLYRPRVVVDGNCETEELATKRANKIMADGKMERDRLMIKVDGHRVTTSAGPGKPWAPGMRVHVLSEPHGVDDIFFITRRTFIQSRMEGQITQLHVIRDGTWLLKLPFIKAKRRSSYGTRKGHYAEGND
jgi:prophage tail gpP-like protein